MNDAVQTIHPAAPCTFTGFPMQTIQTTKTIFVLYFRDDSTHAGIDLTSETSLVQAQEVARGMGGISAIRLARETRTADRIEFVNQAHAEVYSEMLGAGEFDEQLCA